jgi:hypothetical protein
VGDRGRLAPVRCAELAQDVRDMHAGRPGADDECRRDLAVGVAAGEEGQDLRLPGGQLKLFCQGCRADPGRDGVRLPLPAMVAEAGTRATLPKSRWLVGGRWRTRAAGLGAGRGGRACPLSDQAARPACGAPVAGGGAVGAGAGGSARWRRQPPRGCRPRLGARSRWVVVAEPDVRVGGPGGGHWKGRRDGRGGPARPKPAASAPSSLPAVL